VFVILGLLGVAAMSFAFDVVSSSKADDDEEGNDDEVGAFIELPDPQTDSPELSDLGQKALSPDTQGAEGDDIYVDIHEDELDAPGGLLHPVICDSIPTEGIDSSFAIYNTLVAATAVNQTDGFDDYTVQAGSVASDTLTGDQGNDNLLGGGGDDWLSGGDGDDNLAGQGGADLLDGGAGSDFLSGLDDGNGISVPDYLIGGPGNDRIILGAEDFAVGGADGDEFLLVALGQPGHATIADYNSKVDKLFVAYDAKFHNVPSLSVQTHADEASSEIRVDGFVLAVVYGDPVMATDVKLFAFANQANNE
jgi:Ca2+-binding RTX toxin-like protein